VEVVLRGINVILQAALTTASEEELGQVCLDVAERVTESRFGYVGRVGEDGLLHDIAISDPSWAHCALPPGGCPLVGLCGWVLREGRTLLTNAPGDHSDGSGAPVGHPPLDAFLGVPLMERGRTVGIIAVGSRTGGYGEEQRAALESLAPSVVEAFERKRAEEALREAARLSETLSSVDALVHSSLQFDEIVAAALREGAAAIGAETAALSLHEDDVGRFRVAYVHNHPPEMIGVTVRDRDDPHGVEAMRTARTLAVNDMSTDPRVVRDLLDAWPIKSMICAPLFVRGKPIGVVYYSYHTTPHRFSPQEIDFVTKLSSSFSAALENATLYDAQRDIAMKLQESFIHPLPRLEHLTVGLVEAPAAEPGLIGGDFWDVFQAPDGRVVALVGDVGGKGIPAAGLTETVRSTMRAFASTGARPASILRNTNELLLARDVEDLFITALVLVLDVKSGRVGMASAGHPGPLHVTPGFVTVSDPPYGPPLGTFRHSYEDADLKVAPAHSLVLFTDGVTEARRGRELFGERRLVETVEALRDATAQELAEAVLDAARAYAGTLKDDLAVMVLRLGRLHGS
jgi:GAF domain-containing protein